MIWSEIFMEASLISLAITLLYFFVFIDMEEKVILDQLKLSINRLIDEMSISVSLLPDHIKESYANDIRNEETPEVDHKLEQEILDNNKFYFRKAMIMVVIYSSIMFTLSVYFRKDKNFYNFYREIIYPSLIAVSIVITVEALFIYFIIGNFIPIDVHKTMTALIEESQ